MPVQVLLDTDIGSDVDDELALALLWGSSEVDLRAICTSYGDTALRTRIVLRMAELAGRGVQVAPGETTTLSGKDVWWAGIEGEAYGPLAPLQGVVHQRPSAGVALLLDGTPDAELLAIGPLTSVAVALEGGLQVAGITIMGGDWADPSAVEHNIASDHVAAQRVLASGLPITVVGVDVTRQVRFGESEIARFEACGGLGRILGAEMRAWMARWDEDFVPTRTAATPLRGASEPASVGPIPHDPLTALALLEPQLFTFTPPVAVEVSEAGAVRIVDGPGTVRIATAVQIDAARTAMADRIAAGLGEHRTHVAR